MVLRIYSDHVGAPEGVPEGLGHLAATVLHHGGRVEMARSR